MRSGVPDRGADAREVLVVAALVAVAVALRLWRLDFRPLSTDEILTVLIAIGRSYRDVGLGDVWPVTSLETLLTPVYDLQWLDISRTLADPEMHHAHPPLFYWLTYEWIHWSRPTPASLASAVRFLPVVFGSMVVLATYGLARAVWSRHAGRIAAGLMAISPLAVQLSQDARNYTLPLLFVVCALWALAAIVQRHASGQAPSAALWTAWIAANALACYSHYFSVLSIVAQTAAIAILAPRSRTMRIRTGLSVLAIGVLCLPLLRTLYQDYTRLSLDRSDNNWLLPRSLVDPLREAVAGWASMVAPVTQAFMPAWMVSAITGLLVVVTLAVGLMLVRVIHHLRSSGRSPAVSMLAVFAVVAFLELTVIVYGLQRDVFRYARYHFVYFPAVLVLLAVGLADLGASWRARLGALMLVVAGMSGSLALVYGYGLQDAFHSRRIAQSVTAPGTDSLTVMGGDSFLTVAMGLSIGREILLSSRASEADVPRFAYIPWASLADAQWPGVLASPVRPAQIWLVHRPPEVGFPSSVEVQDPAAAFRFTCVASSEGVQRAGLEYHRYECPAER
jgi:uncharacterized membrane protein